MFGSIGMGEAILLVIGILIVFGAGKLPEVFRSVGEGLREFKRALNPESYPEENESPEPERLNTSADDLPEGK